MFTEEQKIRTIELYFKYGKKLAPSYANWATLRKEICGVDPFMEAGGGSKESIRHKHRYSDEQKQVAVEHYLNHGCCTAFTSRTLGYPCTDMLARWVNERSPTDDVYLPVRPIRLRPLNQKSNVRLSWYSVHDKDQPVKSRAYWCQSRGIV